MMNDGKENCMGHLSCKNNTARTEKDLYRICPSKLNKHELEDLYFALMEQNGQLKKTINEQRDQIKVLNTRVQRMTVQKPMSGCHNRDCCSGTKAIINEQRESIADLKKANERLSERLRLLNMRLCSAKQFLRRGSSQAAAHLSKCLVSSDSIKNLSMSALNTKRSNSKLGRGTSPFQIDKNNMKIQLPEIEVPSQLAEINMPTQSAGTTDSPSNRPDREGPCQRNECRTEIDELKLKIVALEEAVLSVRQSHSQRMCALEAAQAQCGARRHTDELSSQLQQQLARVSELRSSRHVDDATDADTTNHTLPRPSESFSPDARVSDPPEPGVSERKNSPPIVVPNNSGISIFIEEKLHKNSDDSGFTDCKNNDLRGEKERTLQEQDDLIENQIANIQSQLLNLKMNAATEVGPQVEGPAIALEAESSLSHNIFSTSKLKTMKFDKVPSTSHEPDVLVSIEGIHDQLPHRSEKTQKYGPEFKCNTGCVPPPSLDMPKIFLGHTVTDLKILENGVTDNHSEDSKRSKGNFKTNSENMNRKKKEPVGRDKNSIIDNHDKSNQIIQEIIEEGKTNETNKNNRRSSFKSSYEGKHYRDLGVRYENSSKSETILKNIPQGTDIEKLYIEPSDNYVSDPSMQYKINGKGSIRRIRYTSDVRTGPCTARQMKPVGIDSAVTANGPGRAEQDVGIQCLRDDTPDASCDAEQMTSDDPNEALVRGAVVDDGLNGPVLCGGLSRVCECTPAFASGRLFLRSCSGAPTSQVVRGEHYRACACGHGPRPPLSSPRPPSCPPEPPEASSERHNSSESSRSPTKPQPAVERPDREVSSLIDTRHTHDTRPSDCVSPGEEKSTYTLSDSYATTEGGSLSEGEVPASGGKRLPATVDNMTEPIRGSRSEKMEDALRTISQELRRCRELLQRSGEKVSPWSSESPYGQGAPPLALRRSEGTCRMRESYAPKCIFTLHVGTVVLADQAAAAARGRGLRASWRLYRQAGGCTRALRGRVFNYDCTVHYDLKVTDHFLYYLKHEEMPIVISDVDKQDEAFATCALPLRDALLHPNRRVDMSLALVSCDGGADAGVLDAWCSLRVDAATLPAINTAIVRPSSLKIQHHPSSLLEQILDDDQSADYRFSKDLRLRHSKGSEDTEPFNSEILDKVPELRYSYNEVIENEVPANIRSVNDFKQAVAKKSNDSTSIYELLQNKKWNRRSTVIEGSQKPQEGGRQKSVTICNQTSLNNMDRGNITQTTTYLSEEENQSLDITILWLALNEGCRAMLDPSIKRLFVAYSFLGRKGADLETPISLPKPKYYMDKCHFLYKKTFVVSEREMLSLGRLAWCMPAASTPDPSRAIVFCVVSEPADDPLGLYSCEDIGYANLYLGEVLLRSSGSSHTAVLEVIDERGMGCGSLAVRLDGLVLLRRCRERVGKPVSTGGCPRGTGAATALQGARMEAGVSIGGRSS